MKNRVTDHASAAASSGYRIDNTRIFNDPHVSKIIAVARSDLFINPQRLFRLFEAGSQMRRGSENLRKGIGRNVPTEMGDDPRTNRGETVFLEPISGNAHNEMAQKFRGRARLDRSLADVFTTRETSKVPFHRDGRDMTRPVATMSKSHEAKSNKKEVRKNMYYSEPKFLANCLPGKFHLFCRRRCQCNDTLLHCHDSTLFRAFPAPQEVGTVRGATSKRTGGARQMVGDRLFRSPGTVEPRTAIRLQPMPRLSLP